LFSRRYSRATILASVPWFLQDLSTYGIGIFTPTILAAALGKEADHVRSLSDLIANDILAARGAAMITLLLIIGIAFAVVLADKLGRIRLQIIGFIGCAVGLLLASLSVDVAGSLKVPLIFTGFWAPMRRLICSLVRSSRLPSAARARGSRQPSPRSVRSRLRSCFPSCW
jgi:MFS family permease